MGKDERKCSRGGSIRVVANPTDEAAIAKIASEVRELCAKFPAPGLRI